MSNRDVVVEPHTVRATESFGDVWLSKADLVAWLAKSEAASEHPHARKVLRMLRDQIEDVEAAE